MEIRPVRAKLFHADERTDMTKLIVAFFTILRKHLQIIDLLTLSQLIPKLLPVFEIFGDEFRSTERPPIPLPIVRTPRPLCNSWHRLCCVLLRSFQVIIQIPWSQLALCCCCCLLLPQDSWRMLGHFHQIELGKRDFHPGVNTGCSK